MSSVVFSSATSSKSSNVTIPISTPSESITGIDDKSYFCIIFTASSLSSCAFRLTGLYSKKFSILSSSSASIIVLSFMLSSNLLLESIMYTLFSVSESFPLRLILCSASFTVISLYIDT